jgi:signal transduction histidine kinase
MNRERPAPVDSPTDLIEAVRRGIEDDPAWAARVRHLPSGEVLMREGCGNDSLHIILEGTVDLLKQSEPGGESVVVDRLGPGHLLGLISVTMREPTLSSSRAVTDVEYLAIGRDELDHLGRRHPRFKELLDRLIIGNLAERYRRVVGSNVEIHRLARALRDERNQLADAIARLDATRSALVSKEKLAVLGQLTAGIAHELNNPAAALQHALQTLESKLSAMLGLADPEMARLFLDAVHRPAIDPGVHRGRMESLAAAHPELPRPLVRRLAYCPDELLQRFQSGGAGAAGGTERMFELLLDVFEAGVAVRGIGVSGERIVRLVKSLKSYSREGAEELEDVDPAEGIRDTLILFKKPLLGIEVRTALEGLPPVRCRPGEVNQVWTNLISNACDAMGGRGILRITARVRHGEVVVRIEDSGPGIPREIRERIFDMNFTTKSGGASFGLGMGLSISRDIIRRHGGTIEAGVAESDLGGASFTVALPVAGAGGQSP